MDCRSYYYFEVHVSYCIDQCNLNDKCCNNIYGYEINEVRKGVVKSIDEGFNITCVIDNIKRDILDELRCNCHVQHPTINISINNVIKITSCDYDKIKCDKDKYDIFYLLDCSNYYC